jgi:hypothetical protein
MTKTTFLFIRILWVLLLFLSPQAVKAQAERKPTEQKEVTGTSTPFQPASEPEAQTPEATDTLELEQRIIRMGDFHLKVDETIDTLILIGGNAKIQGTVLGDVFVLRGNVDVREGVRVMGTVTVVLGKIRGKDLLTTDPFKNAAVPYREINGLKLVPELTLLMMRPQAVWGVEQGTGFWWSLGSVVTLTFLHILLVAGFSRQMDNMAYMISHRPIGSAVLGIIVLVFVPCLIMVLVFSLVGIPLMLLFFSILVPMAIYGKTAIFLSMGNAIFPKQSNIVAVIVGYAIYRMAISTPVPHIDWLTFLVAGTIGIGVCIRTGFGQQSLQPPKPQPPSRQYRRPYSEPTSYR